MDLSAVRLRFDLRGEQISCLLLAIDLAQTGREQVIFLGLAGDGRGHRTLVNNTQAPLARQVAQAARGMPLTLLLAVHAARAEQVVCGDTHLWREVGESCEAFAERVQLALLDLQGGPSRARGEEPHQRGGQGLTPAPGR